MMMVTLYGQYSPPILNKIYVLRNDYTVSVINGTNYNVTQIPLTCYSTIVTDRIVSLLLPPNTIVNYRNYLSPSLLYLSGYQILNRPPNTIQGEYCPSMPSTMTMAAAIGRQYIPEIYVAGNNAAYVINGYNNNVTEHKVDGEHPSSVLISSFFRYFYKNYPYNITYHNGTEKTYYQPRLNVNFTEKAYEINGSGTISVINPIKDTNEKNITLVGRPNIIDG